MTAAELTASRIEPEASHPSPLVVFRERENQLFTLAVSSVGARTPGLVLYAEGDNYRFELAKRRARCAVWRRRDLDPDAGARLAEEMLVHFRALAAAPNVRSLLLDIRKSPPFCGPRTQRALSLAFTAFEEARTPIAVLPASVVQGLQVQRTLALHAPVHGRDFPTAILAEAWLSSFSESRES